MCPIIRKSIKCVCYVFVSMFLIAWEQFVEICHKCVINILAYNGIKSDASTSVSTDQATCVILNSTYPLHLII